MGSVGASQPVDVLEPAGHLVDGPEPRLGQGAAVVGVRGVEPPGAAQLPPGEARCVLPLSASLHETPLGVGHPHHLGGRGDQTPVAQKGPAPFLGQRPCLFRGGDLSGDLRRDDQHPRAAPDRGDPRHAEREVPLLDPAVRVADGDGGGGEPDRLLAEEHRVEQVQVALLREVGEGPTDGRPQGAVPEGGPVGGVQVHQDVLLTPADQDTHRRGVEHLQRQSAGPSELRDHRGNRHISHYHRLVPVGVAGRT